MFGLKISGSVATNTAADYPDILLSIPGLSARHLVEMMWFCRHKHGSKNWTHRLK